MATEPRPWPNNAKHYRDSAAGKMQAAIRALSPIIENGQGYTREELIFRVARALHANQEAIRWLEKAGAPTEPQD